MYTGSTINDLMQIVDRVTNTQCEATFSCGSEISEHCQRCPNTKAQGEEFCSECLKRLEEE